MSKLEDKEMHRSSISIEDIKDAIDGVIHIAQDSLHREMVFDRNKLCTVTRLLMDVSRALENVGDRVEALERRVV